MSDYERSDPKNGEIRYVGCSTKPHNRIAHGHAKFAYFENLTPILTIIDSYSSANPKERWDGGRLIENYWIRKLRKLGHPLRNINEAIR